VKKFDIHLSTGAVHTVELVDANARQDWFMKGLQPSGWICMDGLQNYNMAHIAAVIPHEGRGTGESA
jgi:hypothetical protein